jgi:hypothetical protein
VAPERRPIATTTPPPIIAIKIKKWRRRIKEKRCPFIFIANLVEIKFNIPSLLLSLQIGNSDIQQYGFKKGKKWP